MEVGTPNRDPSAMTEAEMTNPITLTPAAVEMIKGVSAKEGLGEHAVRIGVVGGGCAGFRYAMDFEKEAREDDFTFEQEGIRLLIDPMSNMYLQGVTIDYVNGLQGSGFRFDNPNATSTCGCGSSSAS